MKTWVLSIEKIAFCFYFLYNEMESCQSYEIIKRMERKRMENIKITFIANAGVMLESSTRKLLIDGVHCEKVNGFSAVPEKTLEDIVFGRGRFEKLDYLLCTHLHPDHCHLEKALACAVSSGVRKVILPKKREWNQTKPDNLFEMNLEYGDMKYFTDREMGILYFRTPHQGPQYADVLHYSFVIQMEGVMILFLGDADFSSAQMREVLAVQNIDVVFANLLVTNSVENRIYLQRELKPNMLVICHLPFAEDDVFGYRKLVLRDMERFQKELPRTEVLMNPFDQIDVR